MQNASFKNVIAKALILLSMFKRAGVFLLFLTGVISSSAQVKVTFTSKDSLEVTADYYMSGNRENRFIIMLHQSASSRAEYTSIAPKIKNLDYNCLAVDLRCGEEFNFIKNETAKEAHKSGKPRENIDAVADIEAAIDYAYVISGKRVILMGSGFSASLCLMLSNANPKVKAVIAFSPAEYFRNEFLIKDKLKDYDKKVFASGNNNEYKYIKEMLTEVSDGSKFIYAFGDLSAPRGAKILHPDSPFTKEVWLVLMMYFNELKKDPFF